MWFAASLVVVVAIDAGQILKFDKEQGRDPTAWLGIGCRGVQADRLFVGGGRTVIDRKTGDAWGHLIDSGGQHQEGAGNPIISFIGFGNLVCRIKMGNEHIFAGNRRGAIYRYSPRFIRNRFNQEWSEGVLARLTEQRRNVIEPIARKRGECSLHWHHQLYDFLVAQLASTGEFDMLFAFHDYHPGTT